MDWDNGFSSKQNSNWASDLFPLFVLTGKLVTENSVKEQ